jgi:very-short-patch-repair endonuclease
MLKPHPTKEALALKHALEEHGIRVLAEVSDGYKHVDLAIPSARINIEVDGIQHLTNPYQVLRDLSRSHYSEEIGYDTLHIHNEEIRTNLPKIAKAVAEAAKMRERHFNTLKKQI